MRCGAVQGFSNGPNIMQASVILLKQHYFLAKCAIFDGKIKSASDKIASVSKTASDKDKAI